jgi:hypothetical protein
MEEAGHPDGDSGPSDAQGSEASSADSGLDHATPDSSTPDANAPDTSMCIATGDICNWDTKTQMWGTLCCTKKCAQDSMNAFRCVQ